MTADTKTFEIHGQKFHARRNPHTGFVYLTAEKGELPPALAGQFTCMEAVRSTLNAYFSSHGTA